MEIFTVLHRKTGLKYRLSSKPHIHKDAYYLSCNDGMVPSGQMIYRTEKELDILFETMK